MVCRSVQTAPGVIADVTSALSFEGMTLAEARQKATALLAAAGREPATIDARFLLQAAVGRDHAALIRDAALPLPSGAAAVLAQSIARRVSGEPLSRILGYRDFAGIKLEIRPGVLDPRDDTAAVVRLAQRLRPHPSRILDLGTGSGALLCALLQACPEATGIGTDLAAAACLLARDNADQAGVSRRATIVRGRWCEALAGSFDLIVSNPPYVRRSDLPGLSPEVRDHDPLLALDGGPDGLDAYRAILRDIHRVASPDALLVLELGAGDLARVETLLEGVEGGTVGTERDAGGHVRAVAAQFRAAK